ncbi:MAG: hypothetical protein IJ386_09560 [Clostridia bacterium]|nr:hypothetical protein [Clostridia bacterium]
MKKQTGYSGGDWRLIATDMVGGITHPSGCSYADARLSGRPDFFEKKLFPRTPSLKSFRKISKVTSIQTKRFAVTKHHVYCSKFLGKSLRKHFFQKGFSQEKNLKGNINHETLCTCKPVR